ncbi:hypothetical protein [Cognatiyoonia sp. IB215446]|uniref:hypothetical protein n=1 Tax=Cognatiyoonia sp. IB215446 TaxID=3097355 RepID=UPI002A24B6E2|nr:hypothetical protein [Cognatiyoonia sp. IB215446]
MFGWLRRKKSDLPDPRQIEEPKDFGEFLLFAQYNIESYLQDFLKGTMNKHSSEINSTAVKIYSLAVVGCGCARSATSEKQREFEKFRGLILGTVDAGPHASERDAVLEQNFQECLAQYTDYARRFPRDGDENISQSLVDHFARFVTGERVSPFDMLMASMEFCRVLDMTIAAENMARDLPLKGQK